MVLEKEEIKAASGDSRKVVHLREFVDAADIDPVFFEKTYVGWRDDADPYRLLHEALRRTGKAGIGRFTPTAEYLVALRALDDALALHASLPRRGGGRRRPGDRRRRPQAVEAGDPDGRKLVETLYTDFDPEDYEDTYARPSSTC